MIIMRKQKREVFIITAFLSLLFVILGLGYSHSYYPGTFPDELAHMGYVADVIKNNFPNYNEGLIFSKEKLNYLNHPALYYMIVGELAKLLNLQDNYASLGRYVSMAISVIIITMTCNLVYKNTKSLLATFVGGAFLLVIPMFVVLGSAINNDQINILGCTFFIYGLIDLLRREREEAVLTSNIVLICAGGIIASLSKATGSLAIVCLIASVSLFNYFTLIKIIKKISLKQWLLVFLSGVVVVLYFACIHASYGKFYPAPQGNPATWFFVDNPTSKRFTLLEFVVYFFQNNLLSLVIPYGHVQFIDSQIRAIILKGILIMLGIMAAYILVKKTTKNGSNFNLEFSLVIGFVLFFVIYLFTIRQLHLNTGYTGAMQARYFFGFLPIFSLIIARVMSRLNSKIVQLSVTTIMVAGLVTSFYPALVKFSDLRMWQSSIFVEQSLFDTHYGFLTRGRTFEQTFMAESNSINGVELMLATFARTNHGELTLELLDRSGVVITREPVKMETLNDTSYAWFDLHHAKLLKNQTYRLRLKCDSCIQDNSITWWALKPDYEAPVFLFSKFGPGAKNMYPKGDAYVDGVKVGGSFSFRLYFQ